MCDSWSRRSFIGGVGLVTAALSLRSGTLASADPEGDLPPLIFPRHAWKAESPGRGMRSHQIEHVTVHHTGPPPWYGSPAAPAYLRQIQAFHTGGERGWPDIAYHLLIDLAGGVWEGRPLGFAGDSATAYDPAGHALIAVLGDYDVQAPNTAQIDALATTTRWLLEAYSLDAEAIGGHRDLAATACPGRNLYAVLGELTARL